MTYATVLIAIAISLAMLIEVPLALRLLPGADSDALAGWLRLQPLFAVAGVAAMLLPSSRGPSVALAAVWAVWCVVNLLMRLVRLRSPAVFRQPLELLAVVACGFLVVGATWLVIWRTGATPFGLAPVIVEATAVHFHYAGLGALTLILSAIADSGPRSRRWLWGAAALAVIAVPTVAAGFVLAVALLALGAVLLASALWVYSVVMLVQLWRPRALGSLLLVLSAATLLLTMLLAADYGIAQAVRIPSLTIPEMALVHGTLNALVVVIGGLFGRRRYRRCAPH